MFRPPIKPRATRGKTEATTSPDCSTLSFESASDIRNYIYQDWKEKKNKLTKENILEKKKREKEEIEKKKKVDKTDFHFIA